jgi:hypothetical protein
LFLKYGIENLTRRAGKTEKEAHKSLATAYVFFVD